MYIALQKILPALLLTLSLLSCAAPVPVDNELSPFISRKELLVVSLAQEGMELYNNGRLFESEVRLRKALYLNPDLDNVRFNLAITLEKAAFYQEAKQIIDKLVQKYPTNYNYHAALGRIERARSNYSAAEREFKFAANLASQQSDFTAELNLDRSIAALQLAEGNSAAAICQTEQVLQLSTEKNLPGGPEIFAQLITILLSEGKIIKADYLYNLHASRYFADNSAGSLYLLSQILFASDRYDDVVLLSERALTMSGVDAIQKFELSILNMLARYKLNEPELFQLESEQYTLVALNQSLTTGSLTSLYWSPQMIGAAWDILRDPKLQEYLDKQ